MNKIIVLSGLLLIVFTVVQGIKVLDYVNSVQFNKDITSIFN